MGHACCKLEDARHTNAIQVTETAEPDVIDEEGAPGEELGFEPPNVRVTVAAVPTDEPKAVVALEASKAVPEVKSPVCILVLPPYLTLKNM